MLEMLISPTILTAIFAVLFVVAIISTFWLPRDTSDAFGAAFMATAALVPMLASVLIVVCYLLIEDGFPVLLGSVIALIVWALVATFYRGFTSADRANTTSYNELCQRLDKLNSRLHAAYQEDTELSHFAHREAWMHSFHIASKLGVKNEWASAHNVPEKLGITITVESDPKPSRGLHWVLATGYINLWNRIHRAEEVLILIGAPEAIIQGAVHDELRLLDSPIGNRRILAEKLWQAIAVLDKSAIKYLIHTEDRHRKFGDLPVSPGESKGPLENQNPLRRKISLMSRPRQRVKRTRSALLRNRKGLSKKRTWRALSSAK